MDKGCSIFEPGENYIKYKEEVPGLLLFLPILFRRKSLIAVIVLLSFLVTLVNIIGSYYLQSIIDRLIPQEDYSLLIVISLGLCIAYLAQQVFTFSKILFYIDWVITCPFLLSFLISSMSFLCPLVSSVHVVLVKSRHVLEMPTLLSML